MRILKFSGISLVNISRALSILIVLANFQLIFLTGDYKIQADCKTSVQFSDLILNNIAENIPIKISNKIIPVSFCENFFSFEYKKKALGKQPKIFIIISETDSETNIRNSSFLFSQISTST